MFSSLLLVAIFSSALSFYAEAQRLPPKCDETLIKKIYKFWNENGGIPQRMIERNIRCTEREVAVSSSVDLLEDNIKCYIFRHFASSNLIYYKIGENVTIRRQIYEQFNGQVFEPLTQGIRFEVALRGATKLVNFCSRNPKATEGPAWFMIRGVEGKITKEDKEHLTKLMVSFTGTQPQKTYEDSCPVPNEEPLIGSCCG